METARDPDGNERPVRAICRVHRKDWSRPLVEEVRLTRPFAGVGTASSRGHGGRCQSQCFERQPRHARSALRFQCALRVFTAKRNRLARGTRAGRLPLSLDESK